MADLLKLRTIPLRGKPSELFCLSGIFRRLHSCFSLFLYLVGGEYEVFSVVNYKKPYALICFVGKQ